MNNRIMISPELSAQGVRKRPNPMIVKSCQALTEAALVNDSRPLVVDYGCGQLRNVETLLSFSDRLVLVDTEKQLATPHDFYGHKLLASEFVKKHWPKANVRLLTSSEFSLSPLRADVIFIINVIDVVPEQVRRRMIRTAIAHLKQNRGLVLIVPRNDAWTLRICTPRCAFEDGFAFKHPQGYTFYKNWAGETLQEWARSQRLAIVCDLSCYRQACLVCRAACQNR